MKDNFLRPTHKKQPHFIQIRTKDSLFLSNSGQKTVLSHPKLDERLWTKASFISSRVGRKTVSFCPILDERQLRLNQSWTKDSFLLLTLDKRQFRFIQSWMKDSFLRPTLDEGQLYFILSWTKVNFNHLTQKTVLFHP